MKKNSVKIIVSGSSCSEWALSLAASLEISGVQAQTHFFCHRELCVKLTESLEMKDVFLVQSFCDTVNDHVVELALLADLAREQGALKVTALIPYLAYGRQNKPQPAQPTALAVVVKMLRAVGIDQIVTLDAHGLPFQNLSSDSSLISSPLVSLSCAPLFAQAFRNQYDFCLQNWVVVAPDQGGQRRASEVAECLNLPWVLMEKKRFNEGEAEEICQIQQIKGDVRNKNCFIIDDLADTGGTLRAVVKALKAAGALKVIAGVTHVLDVTKIQDCGLHFLFMTDTFLSVCSVDSWVKVLSCKSIFEDFLRKI